MPRFFVYLLATLACMSAESPAQAAGCSTGYDGRACLEQIKRLDRELNRLYDKDEELLRKGLRGYEPEYQDEAVTTVRDTNAAFMKYRDSECYAQFLRDGMSRKDAGVLAGECRVKWRQQRIATFMKQLARTR